MERVIEVTFTEAVLGTASGNKQIYTDFIAAKFENHEGDKIPTPGQPEDEIKALPDVDEALTKGTTYFWRTAEGHPGVFNYWIKGAIKGAIAAMIDTDEFTQNQLKDLRLTRWTYKRTVGSLLFVNPRFIPFELPKGVDPKELAFCERPLRAETRRGARVCLARSEVVPAGSKLTFTLELLSKDLWPAVEWALDYGKNFGMGQWANSGAGVFTWKDITPPIKA
jgi:hypothetical protein